MMNEKKTPERDYYGELKGRKLQGDNVAIHAVDEAYQRMLFKHEDHLHKHTVKIMREAKKTFAEEINSFRASLSYLTNRVKKIEKFQNEHFKKQNPELELSDLEDAPILLVPKAKKGKPRRVILK